MAFAHPIGACRREQGHIAGKTGVLQHDDIDADDELTEREKVARGKWLVCGSEDHRMSIWELITFERK